jgi:hypothetical protein
MMHMLFFLSANHAQFAILSVLAFDFASGRCVNGLFNWFDLILLLAAFRYPAFRPSQVIALCCYITHSGMLVLI